MKSARVAGWLRGLMAVSARRAGTAVNLHSESRGGQAKNEHHLPPEKESWIFPHGYSSPASVLSEHVTTCVDSPARIAERAVSKRSRMGLPSCPACRDGQLCLESGCDATLPLAWESEHFRLRATLEVRSSPLTFVSLFELNQEWRSCEKLCGTAMPFREDHRYPKAAAARSPGGGRLAAAACGATAFARDERGNAKKLRRIAVNDARCGGAATPEGAVACR
ncbi:unnamed protein product [Lampetra fluviatilis]